MIRFERKGKLRLLYIEPYDVLERVVSVADKLRLTRELSWIHPSFHVLMWRKYMLDPLHVLQKQPLEVQENLIYEEDSYTS